MKTIFFAVKDELAETFYAPSLFNTEAEATRNFKTAINNNPIWRDNASDFSLYKLGEFDDVTGMITSELHKVCSGHSVKTKGEING